MNHLFYKIIPFLFFNFLYPSEVNSMPDSRDIQFSLIEENKMEDFEKKIAYYFGTKNPEPIIASYVNALKKLEAIGSRSSLQILEKELIPYLEEAYKEISEQRAWDFDVRQAAKLELQIILGNANGLNFETIQDLMSQLYALVFQSSSPNVRKAAMLRTFLYQYKVDVLKREKNISETEMNLLISLSETSKELLNSIR